MNTGTTPQETARSRRPSPFASRPAISRPQYSSRAPVKVKVGSGSRPPDWPFQTQIAPLPRTPVGRSYSELAASSSVPSPSVSPSDASESTDRDGASQLSIGSGSGPVGDPGYTATVPTSLTAMSSN